MKLKKERNEMKMAYFSRKSKIDFLCVSDKDSNDDGSGFLQVGVFSPLINFYTNDCIQRTMFSR